MIYMEYKNLYVACQIDNDKLLKELSNIMLRELIDPITPTILAKDLTTNL